MITKRCLNFNIDQPNFLDFNTYMSDPKQPVEDIRDTGDALIKPMPPIPEGTLAKVKMFVKPGGFSISGPICAYGHVPMPLTYCCLYLDCRFVVLKGKYKGKKIREILWVQNDEDPAWGMVGRALIRDALSSARGISTYDYSEEAQKLRCVKSITDLDGLEFVACIGITSVLSKYYKNCIRCAVSIDRNGYQNLFGGKND